MWLLQILCTSALLLITTVAHGQQLSVICTEQHNASIDDPLRDGHSIQMHAGDAIVTILTNEPLPMHSFDLGALNAALADGVASGAANESLGLRIIYVNRRLTGDAALHALLLREVQYLQQCTVSPIAILVLHEMWPHVVDLADDIDYNIWRLPPATRLLYPKVAHMLFELPWNGSDSDALTVRADEVEEADAFVAAARAGHLCVTRNATGRAGGVRIALGGEMFAAGQQPIATITTVAVPLVLDDYEQIANLSVGSYVITEADHSARVSLVLTVTAVLGQLTKLMHQSLQDCAHISANNSAITADPFDLSSACKHPENWNLDTVSTLTASDMYAELAATALAIDPTIVLRRKFHAHAPPAIVEGTALRRTAPDLRHIAAINALTNVTTYYNYSDWPAPVVVAAAEANQSYAEAVPRLGLHFRCPNASERATPTVNIYNIYTAADYSPELYWRIRPEIWVACGLTLAVLGILISFAIFVFILVRLYMEDVLEGNPVGTIALLIALIVLFASFVPFCLEYTSDRHQVDVGLPVPATPVPLCATRLVLVMLGYCVPFALLLCRAMMLASIGGEGGFLSHVNGYIQSVICAFSALVQVGMCVQMCVLMVGYAESVSCEEVYYGAWFWALLAYDGLLLGLLLVLAPFGVRSQRNYREGVLIVVGSVLCVAVWAAWIPLAAVDREWRDAAVPLGMQATGWAVLGAILVPRSFLIVRGIARTDMAQALPSLASLAFAHNSAQCMSEQSIYECVNPAMRQSGQPHQPPSGRHGGGAASAINTTAIIGAYNGGMVPGHEDDYGDYDYSERCPSPGEIPTLPLRGASRKARNMQAEYASSQQSTQPSGSPNKATRF